MEPTTIDHIDLYPQDSDQNSNTLICYDFKGQIHPSYKDKPMYWAYLLCIEDNRYEFQMDLVQIRSLNNEIVIRIRTDLNNICPRWLRHEYEKTFKTCLFAIERIDDDDAKKNNTDANDALNYSADSESEEESLNHMHIHKKKDQNTLKKEREIRMQKKQIIHADKDRQNNAYIPSIIDQLPPRPLSNNRVSRRQNIPNISPKVLPPASPSSQSSTNPPSNSSSSSSAILQNQEEEEEKQIILEMPRPKLPRFDFSDVETDIDKIILSDTHSSREQQFGSNFKRTFSPPPPPIKVNYVRYNSRSAHHAPHRQQMRQSFKPNPNPLIAKKNIRNVRKSAPILQNIFGDTQSHNEFIQFHQTSRKTYSEKLKAAPKTEKNPKNYFLLPILTEFGHKIGDKIGSKDYGFHSNAGNISLKGRDSNKYYGADFKIPEKEDKVEQEKKPTSVVTEVMAAKKFMMHDDYYWKPLKQRRDFAHFGCEFLFQQQILTDGFGRSKKDAKKDCSQNVIHIFKTDPKWKHAFSACVNRIELGLKASKNGNEAPIGYEYCINMNNINRHKARKYYYLNIKCDANHAIQLHQSNEYFGGLLVYNNRGIFRDHQRDNPSVEEMYIAKWTEVFKGKRNVPVHCHPALDKYGQFIAKFKDENEKQLWKDIWKVYRKRNNKHEQKEDKCNQIRPNYRAQNKYCSNVKNKYLNDIQPQSMYNNNDKHNKYLKDAHQCEHFVVYDFDGTLYCKRLSRDIKASGRNAAQYINDLVARDCVCDGFGGTSRVSALKEHFKQIRKYRNVRIALSGYTHRENLRQLFEAIDVNMSQWFDVILDPKHEIFAQLLNEQRFSKDTMLQMLCERHRISCDNLMYIDDDKAIKQQVKCCDVIQAQNRGKGLNIEEFTHILRRLESKLDAQNNQKQHETYLRKDSSSKPRYEDRYSQQPNYNYYNNQKQPNHANSQHNYAKQHRNYAKHPPHLAHYSNDKLQMESCMNCEESFNRNELKLLNQMYLCRNCLSNQAYDYNYRQ